jgi:glycosyltransferase involved in cell wall biosynthesis
VYPNSRAELIRRIAAGVAPDTELLGQNHLAAFAVEATVHEPTIRPRGGALARRVLWNARELTIPWEVERDTDVIVTPLAALLPLAARVRGRQRVLVVNYGLCTTWERSSAPRRRLLQASLGSAAAIVCLGSSQRTLLLAQTGLPPDRVVTIRVGVDERFFAPEPPADEREPLVLAVGKDLARDYTTLAEALRQLDVPAVIAALPRNLEAVRLPPRVEAGFVEVRELRELYRRAACVVVPQRRADYEYGSEGGGLTALLEAMASARPIVASERPVLRDYIDDERTALIVPPEDPHALAAAIARVLEDRGLARSLGSTARARIEDGLTTRHFAAGVASLVKTVAES